MHLLGGGCVVPNWTLGGRNPELTLQTTRKWGKRADERAKTCEVRIFPVFHMKILAHGQVNYGWGLSQNSVEFPVIKNGQSHETVLGSDLSF